MDQKPDTFTLPLGPKGLCFDRNQFLGSNFSVDVFLHNHRNVASLETLRDDLGMYLKVLRSAMIELINRDYADFVDLSANLIGLDKEIEDIRSPLGQLREEVLNVKECLSDAMKELSGRLEQRKTLREKKRSLYYLGQTRNSLVKLSKLLNLDSDDVQEHHSPRDLIERASSEFVQLKFTITKCESFISSEQKNLYEQIGKTLLATLEEMFLENLNVKKMDKVQRCLHIYSMLDKISDVETVLREKVIAPALHNVISESALQKSPSGLKGILENVLSFFEKKIKDLVAVTKSNKSPAVRNFNFVLNSFWPEVEYRLEIHLSSIFAPGNPELFYSRYNDSLDFLKKIQLNFDTKKERMDFYNHPSYKNFQQKWNLPIYFQIRFQKIAGSLEQTLVENINNHSFNQESNQEFALKATTKCWNSLISCWAEGIFISALTHRFWKLSLQIISRYCTWVNTALKQSWSNNSVVSENANKKPLSEKLKFSITLYIDVNKLNNAMPTFMEIVKARLQTIKHIHIFEKCLMESKLALESKLPQIKKSVILQISSESIGHLKQINDIPRLFRKTNREVPSKPCTYVNLLMQSPLDFNSAYKSSIGEPDITEWMESIFSTITVQYYTAVEDVLTSIQKTEDSLRRLKQIRERPSQQNSEKVGISDDDKIRIQLKVDVESYCKTLIDVKCDMNKIEKSSELINLVEKASAKNNTTNQ